MPVNLLDDPALKQRPRLREACSKIQEIAVEVGPEARMPTISELHEQLGMGVQTIYRAVRELEQRNVLRTVHGVGIYVASAQKLSANGTIGVISTNDLELDNDHFYWSRVFAGMRSEAAKKQKHLLLIDNAEGFSGWEKIDGAILNDARSQSDPRPKLQRPPKGFPCIALMNSVPGIISATADDFAGMYLMTQHLLNLGHRRIAYLASLHSGTSLLEHRRNGFMAALKDEGIVPDPLWTRGLNAPEPLDSGLNYYFETAKYTVSQWLQDDWKGLGCTAMVAQNDNAAYGAMSAFIEAGISVPQQVSVVGFDGSGAEYQALPKVTSARVPLFNIGQTAVRLLMDWLDDPTKPPSSSALPVEVIKGESSAPPPG